MSADKAKKNRGNENSILPPIAKIIAINRDKITIKVLTPYSNMTLGANESFFAEKVIFKMDLSLWWSSTYGIQTRSMLNYLVLKKHRMKKGKVKVRKRKLSFFLERFFRRFLKKRK